jgi:hypothetical protein
MAKPKRRRKEKAMRPQLQKIIDLRGWPSEAYQQVKRVFATMMDSGCGNETIKNFFANVLSSPEYFCKAIDKDVDGLARAVIKYRRVK